VAKDSPNHASWADKPYLSIQEVQTHFRYHVLGKNRAIPIGAFFDIENEFKNKGIFSLGFPFGESWGVKGLR
jgi:hypothetical protein